MVVLRRYNTISVIPHVMNVEDYELYATKDYGDEIVDRRMFVPVSEQLKLLGTMQSLDNNAYMFPDGKDDGRTLIKRGADLAEISQMARNADQAVKDVIVDAQKKAVAKTRAKAEMDAATVQKE